jgi:hypothetical protein
MMMIQRLPKEWMLHPLKQSCPRHKFLKAEDDQLRLLVAKFGESNWNLIALYMSRRNARQCRERYRNYLSPNLQPTPWTSEEETRLCEKVREFGPKWSKISAFFPGRTEVNVKNQWAAINCRNARVEKYAKQKEVMEVNDELFDTLWAVWPVVQGEENDFGYE